MQYKDTPNALAQRRHIPVAFHVSPATAVPLLRMFRENSPHLLTFRSTFDEPGMRLQMTEDDYLGSTLFELDWFTQKALQCCA